MPEHNDPNQPVVLTAQEVDTLLEHSQVDAVTMPTAYVLRQNAARKLEFAWDWDEPPSLRDVRERLAGIDAFTERLASAAYRMALETNDEDPATVLQACRELRDQLRPVEMLLTRACGIMNRLMPDLPEWQVETETAA